MDQYLDLLMDHSVFAAKSALIKASLPLHEDETKLATKNLNLLSDTEIDDLLGMCATLSRNSLSMVATAVTSTATDRKYLILYTAALAPLVEAFNPSNGSSLHDVHAMMQHVSQTAAGAAPDAYYRYKLDVARGAYIHSITNGAEALKGINDIECYWLGLNYQPITTIADALKTRRSTDPILITELLRKPFSPLQGHSL